MPRRNDNFFVMVYCLKSRTTLQVFKKLWTRFADAPFSATKYDSIERTTCRFSVAAWEHAHRLFQLSVLLVRGKSVLASYIPDAGVIERWTFSVDPKALSGRGQEKWIDWLARFFTEAGAIFACACTESEHRLKHSKDLRLPGGNLRTDKVGYIGASFERTLPGVYWLNYYGKEIVSRLGRGIEHQAAFDVRHLSGGQILATIKEPMAPPDLETRLALERSIALDLGAQFFFDKETSSNDSVDKDIDPRKRQVPELAAVLNKVGTKRRVQ